MINNNISVIVIEKNKPYITSCAVRSLLKNWLVPKNIFIGINYNTNENIYEKYYNDLDNVKVINVYDNKKYCMVSVDHAMAIHKILDYVDTKYTLLIDNDVMFFNNMFDIDNLNNYDIITLAGAPGTNTDYNNVNGYMMSCFNAQYVKTEFTIKYYIDNTGKTFKFYDRFNPAFFLIKTDLIKKYRNKIVDPDNPYLYYQWGEIENEFIIKDTLAEFTYCILKNEMPNIHYIKCDWNKFIHVGHITENPAIYDMNSYFNYIESEYSKKDISNIISA